MSQARLRSLGVPATARLSLDRFNELFDAGTFSSDSAARASIRRPPSGLVFRVAVGVTGQSVAPDWSAFDQRYQWFGQQPRSLTSGAHLFVLAVDRWKSAVVGLYEAVSAGADQLPGSPDPDRWPYALGVRPLAAVPPPNAVRVDGQRAPMSGLPERVTDEAAIDALYEAVADSPPPPAPTRLEQRVMELEPRDVAEDVLEAVVALGHDARGPDVVRHAIDIGEWNSDELAARAWYTGGGQKSHIQLITGRALDREMLDSHVERNYGSSPFTIADPSKLPSGVTYRRAGGRGPSAESRPRPVDLAELERATQRHMDLQDRLADELLNRGLVPHSPAAWHPQFDISFDQGDVTHLIEVKSGSPPPVGQIRLGVGQVLEYAFLYSETTGRQARPAVLIEGPPPTPWGDLCKQLGISLLDSNDLAGGLTAVIEQAREYG